MKSLSNPLYHEHLGEFWRIHKGIERPNRVESYSHGIDECTVQVVKFDQVFQDKVQVKKEQPVISLFCGFRCIQGNSGLDLTPTIYVIKRET